MDVERPVTFGIKTSQANTTYDRVLATWLEADKVDVFEHAWLWDHLVPLRGDVSGPALEAWTLLAALAARTTRLRLGIIVTNNRTRNPAVLAKMAATVDQIAGGRLVFGLGAGGSRIADPAGRALVEREFNAYGIPVVTTGEAIDALGEALQIIERMWSEKEPFDFDGRWHQLQGAICEPKPVQQPRPPILIGAGGRRSLRVVAEHADIWITSVSGDIAEFGRQSRILDDHCAEIGRDHAAIERSVQLLVREPGAAAPATAQPNLPSLDDPSAARDHILAFIDAGVRHIVLAPVAPTIDQPAHWLAEEVVEPVLRSIGQASGPSQDQRAIRRPAGTSSGDLG